MTVINRQTASFTAFWLAAGLLLTLFACKQNGQTGSASAQNGPRLQSEGTQKMVKRLAILAQTRSPQNNPYDTAARATHFRTLVPEKGVRGWHQANFNLAHALLSSGETLEAIDIFHELDAWLADSDSAVPEGFKKKLWSHLAVSHLRLGEEDNCLQHHNAHACIFPIQNAGRHQLERGSRGATEIYLKILAEDPGDLEARWLLNLAKMTLGEYPEGVPAKYLIPPAAFDSGYPMERFPDVASQLGLGVADLAGGSILDDFDNDGYLDLFASSWSIDHQLRYFRNLGNGRFEERTAAAGLTGMTGGLNLIQADYDNDGFLDVLVLRGAWRGPWGRFPNSLLRNQGDGSFEDVTERAGIMRFCPSQTAAWADFNNDGLLDLFVGNESVPGFSNPCELYQNLGDGSFVDIAQAAGITKVGFIKGAAWGDIDNDGLADLYISRLQGPNFLYKNLGSDAGGQIHFEEVAFAAGVTQPVNGFPTWFFDYDNDGWLDIYASAYGGDYLAMRPGNVAADYLGLPTEGEISALYRNNGDGSFEDVTIAVGLDKVLPAMGANFGDLDNDGFSDFYLGTGSPDFRNLTPNRMFRNNGGNGFQDVTTAGGFGHLQKGHGVSFGDIDNDGDQDIYAVMGGAFSGDVYPNVLFLNPGHKANWITLILVGETANRSAIGARLHLQVETPEGLRNIHTVISSGGSFGASPLRAEIGLGNGQRISKLTIHWPGGTSPQELTDLAINQFLKVFQSRAEPAVLDLKPLVLEVSGAGAAHHHHGGSPVP